MHLRKNPTISFPYNDCSTALTPLITHHSRQWGRGWRRAKKSYQKLFLYLPFPVLCYSEHQSVKQTHTAPQTVSFSLPKKCQKKRKRFSFLSRQSCALDPEGHCGGRPVMATDTFPKILNLIFLASLSIFKFKKTSFVILIKTVPEI